MKFLFDKVGRVQVHLPPGDDREARIEAAFEAAGSAGGEDFEIVENSDLVEVLVSMPSFVFIQLFIRYIICYIAVG